jgi:hypothetical protein
MVVPHQGFASPRSRAPLARHAPKRANDQKATKEETVSSLRHAALSNFASRRNLRIPGRTAFIRATQLIEAYSKNAFAYGNCTSGRTIYAYVNNNPVNANDPMGLDPNDPSYRTPEEAFNAAFIASGLGMRGYFQNREYGTRLYQATGGGWGYLPPIAGGRTGVTLPPPPSDAVTYIDAHSHGQPRIPEKDGIFGLNPSPDDFQLSFSLSQRDSGRYGGGIVLTSDFKVLQYQRKSVFSDGAISVQNQSAVLWQPPNDPLDRQLYPSYVPDFPIIGAPGSAAGEIGLTSSAAGGYLLYPNRPNNNFSRSAYAK